MMSDKELSTQERGSFELKSGINDGVMFRVIKWIDNPPVLV